MRELTQKVIDKLPKKMEVAYVDEETTNFSLDATAAVKDRTFDRICIGIETEHGTLRTAILVPQDDGGFLTDHAKDTPIDTIIDHVIQSAVCGALRQLATKNLDSTDEFAKELARVEEWFKEEPND